MVLVHLQQFTSMYCLLEFPTIFQLSEKFLENNFRSDL